MITNTKQSDWWLTKLIAFCYGCHKTFTYLRHEIASTTRKPLSFHTELLLYKSITWHTIWHRPTQINWISTGKTEIKKCSWTLFHCRCRSSRGENLDCMGTVSSPHTMEMNGCSNRSQQRSSNRENWGKIPEQQNGHSHQVSFDVCFLSQYDLTVLFSPLHIRHHLVRHQVAKIKDRRVIQDVVHRRRKVVKVVPKAYRRVSVMWNEPTDRLPVQ